MTDRIEARRHVNGMTGQGGTQRRRNVLTPANTPPEVNFLDAATEARRARDLAHQRLLERQKAEARAQHAATSPLAARGRANALPSDT